MPDPSPYRDLLQIVGERPRKLATVSEVLTTDKELADLIDEIRADRFVTFDTEFVSESFYRPKLCLLQFGTLSRCVAVDPFTLGSLTPVWDILTEPSIVKLVHGGREEIRFCLRAAGRVANVIDIQVAQGFLGRSFPMAYKAIAAKTIGVQISTHETRTDWSRRPLSSAQIRYALEDVEHLLPIAMHQAERLSQLGRTAWAEEEFERLVETVATEPGRDTFLRVSGVHRLRGVELAIADALHEYRRDEAERLNKPVKHVLRDDLLVDIARRQPKSRSDLFHTRGVSRKLNNESAERVVELVADAKGRPKSEWPRLPRPPKAGPGDETLVKLLGLALSDRCAKLDIAMSLVGSQSDIADVVRHHAGNASDDGTPKLLQGWRREVCGSMLADLLEGRVGIRVRDARKADPLLFESVGE